MKKFLSLVLALVMVTSLFTMATTASAADFTDDESIHYVEAIDVISAIGVVDGYSDGSFRPEGNLTRGAAAKIITNLILGPSTASTLTANAAPFSDVPTSHTFAAPIAYCSQNGIISGYGDGTFRPDGKLTGYAFLKMLLGALGYDSSIEGFTGGNWSINVAKLADGIGLTNDLLEGFTGTSSVNRETACLFAFNTLKADLVEYDNRITANVGGVDINIGGTNAAKSVVADTQATVQNASNIIAEAASGDKIIQFGERYFPRLVRNNKTYQWNAEYRDLVSGDGLDNMGRPASKWTYMGEKIGTYSDEPDVTYAGSEKLNKIYSDLNMNTAAVRVYIYMNGVLQAQTGDSYDGDKLTISRSYDEKLSNWSKPGLDKDADAKVGDGTIVEVFHNDLTNEVIISCQSVYGGKISAVKAANDKKDDYVVVDGGDNQPANFYKSNHNEFETTAFKVDDVVAYTYSDKEEEIASMYKMESVTGSLSKYTSTKNLTLGDTTYKYAQEITFGDGMDGEEDFSNRSSYIVYLDSNGYALWVEEDEFSADSYAVILRITGEADNGEIYGSGEGIVDDDNDGKPDTNVGAWDGNRARLLFSDGTKRTVELDKAYLATDAAGNVTGIDSRFKAGQIVRWRVDDKGAYKLTTANGDTKMPTGTFKIDNRKVEGFSGIEFDGNTLFVVNENGDFTTYIGIRNAPNITGATNTKVHAYVKDGVCKVLYVEDGTVINSGKSVVFIAGESASKPIKGSDGDDYYTYNAVVRGEIMQISVKAEQKNLNGTPSAFNFSTDKTKKANLILNQTSFDADDVMTHGSLNKNAVTGVSYVDKIDGKDIWGIKKVSGNDIRVNTWDPDANGGDGASLRGSLLTLADNAKVYLVDDDGDIEAIEISDINTDSNVKLYYVLDDGDISTLFIVEQ